MELAREKDRRITEGKVTPRAIKDDLKFTAKASLREDHPTFVLKF